MVALSGRLGGLFWAGARFTAGAGDGTRGTTAAGGGAGPGRGSLSSKHNQTEHDLNSEQQTVLKDDVQHKEWREAVAFDEGIMGRKSIILQRSSTCALVSTHLGEPVGPGAAREICRVDPPPWIVADRSSGKSDGSASLVRSRLRPCGGKKCGWSHSKLKANILTLRNSAQSKIRQKMTKMS